MQREMFCFFANINTYIYTIYLMNCVDELFIQYDNPRGSIKRLDFLLSFISKVEHSLVCKYVFTILHLFNAAFIRRLHQIRIANSKQRNLEDLVNQCCFQ